MFMFTGKPVLDLNEKQIATLSAFIEEHKEDISEEILASMEEVCTIESPVYFEIRDGGISTEIYAVFKNNRVWLDDGLENW